MALAHPTIDHLEHGIEIGGRLAAFEGTAWRIDLVGAGATPETVDTVMSALRKPLGR